MFSGWVMHFFHLTCLWDIPVPYYQDVECSLPRQIGDSLETPFLGPSTSRNSSLYNKSGGSYYEMATPKKDYIPKRLQRKWGLRMNQFLFHQPYVTIHKCRCYSKTIPSALSWNIAKRPQKQKEMFFFFDAYLRKLERRKSARNTEPTTMISTPDWNFLYLFSFPLWKFMIYSRIFIIVFI